jgi:SnoaL-like domain
MVEGSSSISGASEQDGVALAQPVVRGPQAPVVRWVEAFNRHDLDGMLACLAKDVDFYPLRMLGIDGLFHGHRGVREWWARLEPLGQEHQIVLAEVRDLGDGRVLASGSLTLGGECDLGPFSAVDRVEGELIVAAHHYLSDTDTIERIGLIG